MSESETIVTAPATKEKNPKRVAQGKRLAEISKAAMAKKKLMMEEEKRKESNVGINYNCLWIYWGRSGVGVGSGVGVRLIEEFMNEVYNAALWDERGEVGRF